MEPLEKKPSTSLKRSILATLFGLNNPTDDVEAFDTYFEHYESELLKALQFRRRLTAQPVLSVAATNHEDILSTVRLLRENSTLDRATIREKLKLHYQCPEDSAINAVIDITVRLWLMLNVRELYTMLQAPQTPIVSWGDGQSLADVATSIVSRSRWTLEAKDSRIHPSFTASFMVDVCGLKLEWTTCLADHLRLDRREKALRIFPYKAVLGAHLRMSQCVQAGVQQRYVVHKLSDDRLLSRPSPLPSSLLQETIWSLNLLFPHWEAETNQLLRRHGQNFEMRGPYDLPSTLSLVEFDRWRDRLLELHDVIFMSPPVSWAQLWRDRRNPQQFWTFWIALIILGLTLVSTITGVVQAWASIRSLKQSG